MRKAISIILVVSFLMSLFVVTVGATQTRVDYFNKSYTLTGDPAYDIASVAEAQIGKTGASFGYTEHWCADFVSDCARLAGISTAVIPYTGGVSNMYNAMISSGATQVSSPQRGDLAFYSNASGWCHVAVMTDSVNSVHGNVNGQEGNFINTSYVTKCSYGSYTGGTATFVRPTYTPVSYNTVSIPQGQYMIWNHATGRNLVVEGSADVSQQNIGAHPISTESGMKFEIIEESNGHSIRPHCSLTRVVNVYADAVSSGDNVNLFTNTANDGTQRWLFEFVRQQDQYSYYIIRNAQNPSCVLTQDGTNCIVATYTGADNQIWGLVPIETEKPVISDVQIGEVTADGYTITCTVTDNDSVRRVRFPTWTVTGDQDDLLWADGAKSGTTATFRVNKSDHNNEYGDYVTHLYAYDASGNECIFGMKVNFTETGAVITETDAWKNCEHSYKITASTATCASAGTVTYTCDNCEHSYEEEQEKSVSHTGAKRISYSSAYGSVSEFVCEDCGAEYTYDLGVKRVTATTTSDNQLEVVIEFNDSSNQLQMNSSGKSSFHLFTAISDILPKGLLIAAPDPILSSWTYENNCFVGCFTFEESSLSQMKGDKHGFHILLENIESPDDHYGSVFVEFEWQLGQYVYLKPGDSVDVKELLGIESINGYYLEKYDTDVVDCVDGICTAKKGGRTTILLTHNTYGTTTGCTIVVEDDTMLPYLTVTIETVEHAGTIKAGEEITLDLTASAAEQLNALNMRLCFDETKLEFVSGEFQNTLAGFDMKSFNSEPVDCQTEDAELWFTAMDTDGYATVSEGEVIATITLRALTDITEDQAVYSYYCTAASYDSTINDYAPLTAWIDGGVVIGDHPKGDVDLDGNVDLNDATRLFYYVNGLTLLTDDVLTAADYTGNGTVDLNDATRLFYSINGLV